MDTSGERQGRVVWWMLEEYVSAKGTRISARRARVVADDPIGSVDGATCP